MAGEQSKNLASAKPGHTCETGLHYEKGAAMPTTNPVEVMLQHNQWANRQMLKACAKLTSEQFRQRFEMGCGSLHDNLVHVLSSTRAWGDMLAGIEPRPRMDQDGSQWTANELLPINDELCTLFATVALAHPFAEIATSTKGGKKYSFPRGGVISHVMTHAMHHRAQCLNMLRQIGVDPLPPSSVVEWMLKVDSSATK